MTEWKYKTLISLVGLVALPFVLLFGFWLCYQADLRIDTPRYVHYGLPLRTNFWTGCQVYATVETIENLTGKICSINTGWSQCTSLNDQTVIKDGVIIGKTDNCNYNVEINN